MPEPAKIEINTAFTGPLHRIKKAPKPFDKYCAYMILWLQNRHKTAIFTKQFMAVCVFGLG